MDIPWKNPEILVNGGTPQVQTIFPVRVVCLLKGVTGISQHVGLECGRPLNGYCIEESWQPDPWRHFQASCRTSVRLS